MIDSCDHIDEMRQDALRALRNALVDYVDPTEPVAMDDWEALVTRDREIREYPHVKTIW